MSRISEIDMDRQNADFFIGEPSTPEQLAEDRVARLVRDCYIASAELYKLRCDPVTAPFVASAEGELWSIKTRIDLLISELRETQAA